MPGRSHLWRSLALLGLACIPAACRGDDALEGRTGSDVAGDLGDPEAEVWSGDPGEVLAARRPAGGTERDWGIVRERIESVRVRAVDTLPYFGDVLGFVGERFLGTPYEPHTLERPGSEQLVVNLESLDCVTFVENVLVLARLVRASPPSVLDDPSGLQQAYKEELARIRYRGGTVDGYASRLHYFSEWIERNDAKGLVRNISQDLGGVADGSPLDFMSTHPEAYAPLADPDVLSAIARIEARIGATDRFFIPQDQIEEKAPLIRNGDIIAATSTVPGLDVAHTGIALWRSGTLRLLHAPLVGDEVQLSEQSLAERIAGIEGQDGIMVARPVDPGRRGGG